MSILHWLQLAFRGFNSYHFCLALIASLLGYQAWSGWGWGSNLLYEATHSQHASFSSEVSPEKLWVGFDNHCFLSSWGPSLLHRWEVLNLLLRNSRCFWSREETTWGYLLSPITLNIESWKQGLLRDPEASFKMMRPCCSDKSSPLFILSNLTIWASQVALEVKSLPASAGDKKDLGLIPGLGRSPGGGHGNPLQ